MTDYESNAEEIFYDDLNFALENSITRGVNAFQQSSEWKELKFDYHQQDLERRRVEALDLLAKAKEGKNELLSK